MSPIVVIASVILLAALAHRWWSRSTSPKAPRTRNAQARTRAAQQRARKAAPGLQRFAGVKIRLGTTACAAACALANEHFLVDEAPTLPLAKCSETRCRCSFQRLSDRRIDARRWADEGLGALIFSAEERRAIPDRRA